MPICEPFPKKSEKYQPQGILGLNRGFRRECFSNYAMHNPMHKICVALNKEKGIASFRNPVTMRTIRTMKWFFHIADYCTDLLAYPNNREFTWSNRVYGHFCWNCFWEILSYTRGEFWIMWNRQNRLFHITDKTFSKALVNILIGWYNFHRSMKAPQNKCVRYETR